MKKNKGFTLIELLVVIAIIGILAALSVVSFTTAQRQARDAQRKSDLAQYRTSLEAFANANNGLFPYSGVPGGGTTTMVSVCEASMSKYAATCPEDPKSPDKEYWYRSDGSGVVGDATATKYAIWTHGGLESNGLIWVVCSNGRTGTITSNWDDLVAFCPVE